MRYIILEGEFYEGMELVGVADHLDEVDWPTSRLSKVNGRRTDWQTVIDCKTMDIHRRYRTPSGHKWVKIMELKGKSFKETDKY